MHLIMTSSVDTLHNIQPYIGSLQITIINDSRLFIHDVRDINFIFRDVFISSKLFTGRIVD